jgi:hypothetical protein
VLKIETMEAKEKAKELIDKYKPLCGGYWGGKINKEFAKQCALIAVEEILNHHSQEQGLYRIDTYYWQQVKTEINNL